MSEINSEKNFSYKQDVKLLRLNIATAIACSLAELKCLENLPSLVSTGISE